MEMSKFLIILVLILAVTDVFADDSSVLPMAYDLTIKPYLRIEDGPKKFTFEGEVFIDVIPQRNVSEIVLNSFDLTYTLQEYWIKNESDHKMTITDYELDENDETITLKLNENMTTKKVYTIHLAYNGIMNDYEKGFYVRSYVDDMNTTKWFASTLFRQNGARRAFPCLDEPKYKAMFQVKIIRHKSFKTWSNTRLFSTKKIDSENYIDVYETTPRMSTYLVAFIVSDLTERGNGDFSIVAKPEVYDQTKFAFELGKKLLEAFGNYFGLPYYELGIDKMHLVALPNIDHDPMENWGLVTFCRYSYRNLLYHPMKTSANLQQTIALGISHKLANQWFGNLVTSASWKQLWVVEGFASYFSYIILSKIYPEWEIEDQFPIRVTQNAFIIDQMVHAQRLINDSRRLPLPIIRSKAASVIQMIRYAMGEIAFEKSVQEYLKEMKYSNAGFDDIRRILLRNWPQSTKIYANSFLETFTLQVGFPLITVNLSADGKSIEITQKRFFYDCPRCNGALLYTVPFTYTTSDDVNFNPEISEIFLDSERKIIQLPTAVDWVIANIQQIGYYRVNYNEENWIKICKALKQRNFSGIHPINRAQIIDDLSHLTSAKQVSYVLMFDCLEYLKNETHYLPWLAALEFYANWESFIPVTHHKLFIEYIYNQTENIFKYLGFNENNERIDSRLDIYNRYQVSSWACRSGNRECIKKALEIFENMKDTPVPVNIRKVVYCTAMREGNEMHFDQLFEMYKSEIDSSEKKMIAESLGCVKDKKLIRKYYNLILGDDFEIIGNKFDAITSLYAQNPENSVYVFNLITENCKKFAESFDFLADSVFSELIDHFNSYSQMIIFENFKQNMTEDCQSLYVTPTSVEKNLAKRVQVSAKNLDTFLYYLENKNGGLNYNITEFNPLFQYNLFYGS